MSTTLLIALGVTAVVTAVAHLAPDDYANTGVGAVFLLCTWWMALRHDTAVVRAFGLSLGGITEPEPLQLGRIARSAGQAIAWALLLSLIFFPPFWYGYQFWWKVRLPFKLILNWGLLEQALGQLLVIALPEEAFFRGFLQSALDGRFSERWRFRVLGAELGPGWLIAAAVFAVGHLLTIPHPSRLAVFFPALLFGWLRARTGGIGAGVLFHALCNLFSGLLASGYGLR